jgi:hypothetical protein
MICPECGSADVRVSKSSRMSDVLKRLRGNDAFRCRDCRKRFYGPMSFASNSKWEVLKPRIHRSVRNMSARTRRRLVRRLIAGGIFTVAFVLFWLFLRYLVGAIAPPQYF